MKVDGSSAPTANINLANHRLINVSDPVNLQDAATMNYGNSSYLRLDGTNNPSANISLNSNRLINVANPVNPQDAITMAYCNNSNSLTLTTLQSFNPIIWLDSFTANTNIINRGSLNCVFTGTALPTFTANALNGLGILTYDGATNILSSATIYNFQAPSTYFAVVRANNNNNLFNGKHTFFDDPGNIALAISFNGDLFFRAYGVLNYTTTNTVITAGSWYIIVYRFNANFSVDFAINGSPTYENIAGTANATTSGGSLVFGEGNGQYWLGDIAGVYCLPTALPNAQIDQFVGVLAYQFGLTSLLPSTHTYKIFQPLMRNNILSMNNYSLINVANPVNPNDAVNLTYLQSNAIVGTGKSISALLNFGTSTTNPASLTLIISNASFTSSNILIKLLCLVVPNGSYPETFTIATSNTTFTTGSFSFTATITRTDTNLLWGQGLQVQAILFYL
jgi:hypothetical protein